MKKVLYRVTKSYQGGSADYYVKVYPKDMGDYLLERIGENTSGGHNYGYGIKAFPIKNLPKGAKLFPKTITNVIEVY